MNNFPTINEFGWPHLDTTKNYLLSEATESMIPRQSKERYCKEDFYFKSDNNEFYKYTVSHFFIGILEMFRAILFFKKSEKFIQFFW